MNGKIRGKLHLLHMNQMQLEISFNQKQKIIPFRVDCGHSYTQISSSIAPHMGLKSHPCLLGRSILGNGQQKIDYLSPAMISILDIEAPILVKVAPDVQNVLGLDAMVIYDMDLCIGKGEFSILRKPLTIYETPFEHLKIGHIIKKLGISCSGLVPIEDLPPPEESYRRLIDNGKGMYVVDLGTSFATEMIDLNCSDS